MFPLLSDFSEWHIYYIFMCGFILDNCFVEGGREIHQPRTEKPAHASGDDFLSRQAYFCNSLSIYVSTSMSKSNIFQNCRYTRNASLVASGVARNMRRVGNYIKESLDDILYPYRRRPKWGCKFCMTEGRELSRWSRIMLHLLFAFNYVLSPNTTFIPICTSSYQWNTGQLG